MSESHYEGQKVRSLSTSSESLLWPVLPQTLIQAALTTACNKQPEQVCLTLTFKLLTRSRRKESALLSAQRYATNMTASVLEQLRVEPDTTDKREQYGVFQLIADMLDAKSQGTKKGTPLQILAAMLSHKFKNELPPKDFPLTSTLREGVFRECARILFNWYQKVLVYDIDSLPKFAVSTSPAARELFLHWSNQWSIYNAAAATLVPYGRYKGQELRDVGKRAARWLRERLPDTNTIQVTLQQIDILLNQEHHTPTDILKAKRAKHPWKRVPKRYQAVRTLHINQHILDPQRPLVRLGFLSRKEWVYLRDELLELQQFSAQFNEIRKAVDIFWSPRPPAYPTVHPVAVDENQQRLQQHTYNTALSWFRSAFPSKATLRTILEYTPNDLAELETTARTELLAASHLLTDEELQPLSFPRTIRPPSESAQSQRVLAPKDSFALLYNKQTFQYVLAVAVQGKYAKQATSVNIRDHLYYVNFPETPFRLPEQTSVMLFPLECGEKYHEMQFLRPAIDRQRQAQIQRYAVQAQTKLGENPVEDCLPPGIINTARLTSQRNEKGYHDFFIHVSIQVPIPTNPKSPTHIVGFHEHATGYSYAVVNLNGEEVACGELDIPPHVSPDRRKGAYSDNYVYEVAHVMLRLAYTHNALIGLEHGAWNRRATLSRGRNRQRFGRPRKKLQEVLSYKAQLKGLAPAWSTSNVSPTRDCGQCGYRLPKGTVGVHRQHFSCRHCQTQRSSNENSALVVARRTLHQLVEHHVWLQTLKERKPLDE